MLISFLKEKKKDNTVFNFNIYILFEYDLYRHVKILQTLTHLKQFNRNE